MTTSLQNSLNNALPLGESGKFSYLKSKIQVGNSKGPLNFPNKQTVFHHDDVPIDKRKRKEDIIDWKKSKVLDPTYQNWNKSTHPNHPVIERRTMENHINDRSHQYNYNYRAETTDYLRNIEPLDKSTKFHISAQLESTARTILEKQKDSSIYRGQFKRTQEMPIHPNLENVPSWNSSSVLTVKELNEGLDKRTKKAQHWSTQVNATLPLKKEYISPMQSTILFQEEVRQQKSDGTFSLTSKVIRPKSEPLEKHTYRNEILNDKPQTVTLHEHSGVWERNPAENHRYFLVFGFTLVLSSFLSFYL
jgi:hypothetical protein